MLKQAILSVRDMGDKKPFSLRDLPKISDNPEELGDEEHRLLMTQVEIKQRRAQFAAETGLRKLRSKLKYSQSKMAELIGVSLRAYQTYERQEREIPGDALKELYANLNVDLHVLLTGERPEESPAQKLAAADFVFRVSDYICDVYPKLNKSENRELTKAYIQHSRFDERIEFGFVELCFNALFKPNFDD